MNILIEMDLAGSKYHGMAYRCYLFAREFFNRGHKVMIVAASYSHARQKNPIVKCSLQEELVDGIIYKWIKTPKYKGNGIGRVIHMLSYSAKLIFYSMRISKEFSPDIVISAGVTPFEIFGCRRMTKKSGGKLLYEVGDLWPLTPIELGGYSKYHPFIMLMQYAENFAYKHCDATVSLLPCAEPYMAEHGLGKGKFYCIPNGIVESEWDESRVLPDSIQIKIRELKRDGFCLVGYAGSYSLANSLDYAIDAFGQLSNEKVAFIAVGKGPEQERLSQIITRKSINNVYLLPPISKDLIPSFLKEMDILYVGFKKQSLYRYGISPNKLFDYMMSGKSIIQAIDAGNDIVGEAKCGCSISSEDTGAILGATRKLIEMDKDEREKLGNNGREYVLKHHTYSVLSNKYISLFESLLNKE